MVGAVGIELKAMLKTRKLLIPRTAKSEQIGQTARARYTRGTRTLLDFQKQLAWLREMENTAESERRRGSTCFARTCDPSVYLVGQIHRNRP
jgi:hypothetical protein